VLPPTVVRGGVSLEVLDGDTVRIQSSDPTTRFVASLSVSPRTLRIETTADSLELFIWVAPGLPSLDVRQGERSVLLRSSVELSAAERGDTIRVGLEAP
jgi:hypothetical protein